MIPWNGEAAALWYCERPVMGILCKDLESAGKG